MEAGPVSRTDGQFGGNSSGRTRQRSRLSIVACFAALLCEASAVSALPEENGQQHVSALIAEEAAYTVRTRTEALEDNTFRYDTAKGYKAAAACIAWHNSRRFPAHVQYWGVAWEYDTQVNATERALLRCREEQEKGEALATKGRQTSRILNPLPASAPSIADKPSKLTCSCEASLEGEVVKVQPPRDVVAERTRALSNHLTPMLCPQWFINGRLRIPQVERSDQKESCKGYDADQATRWSFPLEELPEVNELASPDIFPGAPAVSESEIAARGLKQAFSDKHETTSLAFGPPTGHGDYRTPFTLPHGWGYRYSLHKLPRTASEAIRKRLAGLDTGKMLRRFGIQRSFDEHQPRIGEGTLFAQYVRSYDMTQQEIRNAFYFQFPEDSIAVLSGERSKRLWVLGAVPVDFRWIPLGAALRDVVPLALETTTDLYIFGEEVESYFRYRGSAGGNTIADHRGVIDFASCDDLKACADKLKAALRAQLAKSFGTPPISASLVRLPQAPQAIQLQRAYEASQVLDGFQGPWFEITTYTISVWDGPAQGEIEPEAKENPSRYQKGNWRASRYIYVHVDLGLQLGVTKHGGYPEPSADQYAAYRKAAQAAIDRAVVATTEQLSGKMVGNVGVVSSLKER